jgi:membrane associated rhomboid family serine protease
MADDERDKTEIKTPGGWKTHVWSLVLWAAGIDHGVQQKDQGHHLLVEPDDFERASHEIYLYEQENPEIEDKNAVPVQQFHPPTIILMGCLFLWYGKTGDWHDYSSWFRIGAVQGEAILHRHEWYRLLTGLTLHADFMHVVGNVVFGGIIVHLLCRMTGTGLGLFLVLLSGISGNLCNVLWQPLSHTSVGFSTAVFGAVGCLSGIDIVRRRSLRGIVIAVGAGLALLAMLGTGGGEVDLGAHLWGFGVGVVLGFSVCFAALKNQGFPSFYSQLGFFVFAVSSLVGAWQYALGR